MGRRVISCISSRTLKSKFRTQLVSVASHEVQLIRHQRTAQHLCCKLLKADCGMMNMTESLYE